MSWILAYPFPELVRVGERGEIFGEYFGMVLGGGILGFTWGRLGDLLKFFCGDVILCAGWGPAPTGFLFLSLVFPIGSMKLFFAGEDGPTTGAACCFFL